MKNLLWGIEPRSTYHKTMVRKVNHYLKQKCDVANYEESLVHGCITDAWGYNKKSKIWYICEIKVDPSDLKKAPQQILDTKFHFPKTRYYHEGDTIVPVIAVPARLANYLVKINKWDSLKNTCKMIKAAIWVIEQSTMREVLNPKINKIVKTKSSRASTTKKKVTKAKKTVSRKRSAKTSKVRKPTAKKKATRPKPSTRLKKRLVKSSTVKTLKTQRAKRKPARAKVAKIKSTRKKQ